MTSAPPTPPVLPVPEAPLAGALGRALPGMAEDQRRVLAAFLSRATAEAGTLVEREGDPSRDLVVVVSGAARLLRAGALVGPVAPGERLFDVCFVAGMPRPASLVATDQLDVARLSLDRFRVLAESHPEVATALQDELVQGLSRPLPGEGGAEPLVRDRSLPRRAQVSVRIHGVPRVVPTGTPARHVLPDRMHGKLVVAALVDRKAVSLSTPLTSECELSPLTTAHWEGQRVHRHSVALLALEAARRVDPSLRMEMGPSLGFAQRLLLPEAASRDLPRLAADLEATMHAIVDENAPLREEWWTVDEAREHLRREGSAGAGLLSTWRDPAVPLVSYGQVYALQMEPLLPHTGMLEGFHLLPGEGVLLLVYGAEAAARPLPSSMIPAVHLEAPPVPAIGAPRVPTLGAEGARESVAPPPSVSVPLADAAAEGAYVARQAQRASKHVAALTLGQERWLATLGVTSVGAFNHACIDGRVSDLIRVGEGFHEKRIGAIADEIRDRLGDVRIVCIAGPSSSGKTTFIRRLQVQLQVDGIHPVGLSLDDYYVDRELTPKDAAGQYDYEALEALRLDLLTENLRGLLDGTTVQTPRFDFESGKSLLAGGKSIQLKERDVLLLEGIHGLNPRLLGALPAERVFRIFVCPLAQLAFDPLSRVHASDVRLIRRIVRDRHSRGTNAAENIQRWPSVREGERRHIFPYQHHADAVFDTSLIYELSVLRVFAERYLLEVPQDHPSYTTAFRLIRLLDRFVTIYPDHVPPTSILREFIGGSGFEY